MKYPCGKLNQGRPSQKTSRLLNETGPGHEVKDAASCMMMMMMVMVMMNSNSLQWYYTDYLLEDTGIHFGLTEN